MDEPKVEPILTETARGLVRRLAHERRRARSESGRRQQQATQSMALVRSFAAAVGVRMPNYLSTSGPKPHEYDACRVAALRLRADLIEARAQVAVTHEVVDAARALCAGWDANRATSGQALRAAVATLGADTQSPAENCGQGHDPAQISCEAAAEINRLRAQVAAVRALADELVSSGEGDRGLGANVRRDVAADILAAIEDGDGATS